MLTAFPKDAGVHGDADGDDDDDDVVVVTSKVTVALCRERGLPLHAAATGVTSAVDALPPAGQGCPRYKPGKQTIDGVQGLQAASRHPLGGRRCSGNENYSRCCEPGHGGPLSGGPVRWGTTSPAPC